MEIGGGDDSDANDYPTVASQAARRVANREADRGILICGAGIGMCIVANKFRGIRAAPCHNAVTAELSRKHNDANILCLSSDMLGVEACIAMVGHWLATNFEGGRHGLRIEKIKQIETLAIG